MVHGAIARIGHIGETQHTEVGLGKNVCTRGGHVRGRPFLFSSSESGRIVFETRAHWNVAGLACYSSPDALAAAPCSRAGQMDS